MCDMSLNLRRPPGKETVSQKPITTEEKPAQGAHEGAQEEVQAHEQSHQDPLQEGVPKAERKGPKRMRSVAELVGTEAQTHS